MLTCCAPFPARSIQLLAPVELPDNEGRAQRLAALYEGALRQELATPLDLVTARELRCVLGGEHGWDRSR